MRRVIPLLVLIPSILFCSNSTTIFDFLNIPCGARPTAIGGGFTAFHDPYSIFYNPAGISRIKSTTISSTIRIYIAGIKSGVLLWERPYFQGVIGAAINYINYGEMERRDEDSQPEGTFTPVSLSTRLAYARELGTFKMGLCLNLIYENIDTYSAFAPALDAGIIYTPPEFSQIDIAFSVNNLGYEISTFNDEKEDLPYKIRAGIRYNPLPPYIFSLDFERQLNGRQNLILGTEIRLSSNLLLRAGYNTQGQDLRVDVPMDVVAGLSLGLGFEPKNLKFDYTVSPMVDLGIAHQFSVSFIQ